MSELTAGGALDVTVKTGLKEDQLIEIIPQFAGLVVRSQTKVNAKVLAAATNLKVVGRAGVGVDNVDVDAATKRGIIVMNTPGGNTISTAELAFSLLLSISRSIPQADASMKSGAFDRKSFNGVEVYGKSLAVIGMGRIGTEVARRAMAFGMRVLAYDPYLAVSRARVLQVELIENLDDLLAQADFITLHTQPTPETHHMLNAERLAKCKKGVRIVNCARGTLIDEAALYEALKSKHVAAAALDVYEVEPPPADFPLRSLPNVVLTPHLGASTAEAQENVGIEVAQQIRAALIDGEIRNAVNMPNIDAKTYAVVKPYLTLGDKLGRFVAQLAPKRNDSIVITYGGGANDLPTDSITRAVLTAFLKSAGGEDINHVNVRAMAAGLGLEVREIKSSEQTDFNEWLHVAVFSGEQKTSAGGSFFGHTARIVRVNGRPVEATPEGILLVLENDDVPGIVGRLGKLLGDHKVNIAGMSLSRTEPGGRALTVLNLD
ncbi:MAG TPA: phosphoglycerate dehydrogenase, partial [Chthoniobacteraceae bacterium]|nr:phosphoglycerate dehydrogenase [Chthoniobacteraceae bacterium]